jgi:hypothetical protein
MVGATHGLPPCAAMNADLFEGLGYFFLPPYMSVPCHGFLLPVTFALD